MRTFFHYTRLLPTLAAAFLLFAPFIALAATSAPSSGGLNVASGLTFTGLIIAVPGFLLYLAGTAFDTATQVFILNMGGLVSGNNSLNIGLGVSIDMIWTIVRDLVNLTFIFGLVYVGFKMILDADTDAKKLLSSIIIGALLVNFSLFISKVVIDVANITATEIYNGMRLAQVGSGPAVVPQELGIAGALMHQMGIISLVSLPNSTQEFERIVNNHRTPAYAVGSALVMLIAAFVFFAGAILIAIRFGVLIILMMLSPIAFAAAVFPSIGGWSKKWWGTLFSQAFFAPAYIFMLYITLVLASTYSTQTAKFDGIFSGQTYQAGAEALIFFALTIVLLVASLIIAKMMGSYGSNMATKVAGKVAFGATAALGRNTIGRLGHRISEKEGLKEAASQGGWRGFMARRTLDATRFAGKSNYDVRAVTDKTGLTKLSTLELGKAQKGGYEQREKDVAKKEAAFGKSLGKDEAKIKAAESLHKTEIADAEKRLKAEQAKRIDDLRDPRERLAVYLERSVNRSLSDAERHEAGALAEAQRERIKLIEDAYRPVITAIEEEKRILTENQKKAVDAAKVSRQESYAKTLENKVSFSPTFVIQTWGENKSAATAVRKEVTKGKDEEATEKIVDAVKGIKKDD